MIAHFAPLSLWVASQFVSSSAPLALAIDSDRKVGKYLTPSAAMHHALAALASETPDAPASVMLALAGRESHYKATSGPRGHWPLRAEDYPRRRHYIAGPCQTTERTVADAIRVRDPVEGYRSCAEQLGAWARACRRWRVPNVRVCQLAGFARGTRDAKASVRTYADDVIERAWRWEKRAARRVTVSS